jgi:riboflavin transporter FmnP
MEGISVQFDVMGTILMGISIALFYWIVKSIASWMVQNGGSQESIGRALLNVTP